MFFQSAGFLLLFAPLALALVAVAPRGRPRTLAIVAVSYVFYSGGEPLFVALLLLSSCVDFVAALRMSACDAPGRRRLWLAASVVTNLGILGIFKYGGMLARNAEPALLAVGLAPVSADLVERLVLPAGISFYTFQSMSYSIDVYRGVVAPTRNFAGFLAFVAYLPQLIAGPIERFGNLYPQLERMLAERATRAWSAGLDRLALGVAQKLLIADGCGRIADRLAAVDGPLDAALSWLFALAFGLQIYYDFAGYTHMAIGVSLLFGIRLSENFLSPYQAPNIQLFWRRWHVTLSNWFRDYLYIPLGGSAGSATRTAVNLLITMTLCGLWHGAGWNYVAWGLGHGLALAGYRLLRVVVPSLRVPVPLAVLATFLLVHVLWVLFRLDDPAHVLRMWSGMAGLHGVQMPVLTWDFVFVLGLLLATWFTPNAAQRWPGRSGPVESFSLWLLALLAVLNSPQVHQFIYFRF